jgi:MSHA biogenesis protein MshP
MIPARSVYGRISAPRLPWRAQRGVGLIAAIFVITAMAVLAAAISALLVDNADNFSEEIQLTRALNAAESGAGFGMNALFTPDTYPIGYGVPNCPAEVVHEFNVAELSGCTATVACSLQASVDDVDYYAITSTGTCGDVRRAVQVRSRFEP